MQDSTDKDLQTVFREVLQADYGRLQRIARSYAATGDHEDLLQEILAQIWRSLPGFDDRATRSSWVYRIALNTAMTSLRKRYAQPSVQSMDPTQLLQRGPSSAGNPTDLETLLNAFLACLSPIDRAVLMLSLDDLSYTEIAKVTGLNTNAVGIRLNRIKQQFTRDYVE